MTAQLLAALAQARVIPIVTLDDPGLAVPMADALVAGGITAIEVTLRTEAGLSSITRISGRPDLVVGAGTVLDSTAAERAIDAGARFVVSPGLNADTVAVTLDAGVLPLPGIATPTELMSAYALGLRVVKVFPAAQLGGTAYLTSLSQPFPDARYVPSGGITEQTAPSYLELPSVLAIGSSWLVPRDSCSAHDLAQVTERAKRILDGIEPRP